MTQTLSPRGAPPIPQDLRDLARSFGVAGHGLWAVGGFVRDFLLGEVPKDIDLCTDATPDEQVARYAALGIRHVPTGIEHGTVTIVLGSGAHEITSMRRDVTSDGRHAVVAYTRDRTEDLARRDLTINALSMDMDGNVLDPFGGVEDLRARRVRFVGSPGDRMREDYLRILRWLRFHGRFSPDAPLDGAAARAAAETGRGLADISRERVWSEVSRIITGPGAVPMMRALAGLGLHVHVGLSPGDPDAVARLAASGGGGDPALAMAAYLGHDPALVEALARDWRWSGADRDRASFVARHARRDLDLRRALAVDGRTLEWVVGVARADGRPEEADGLASWPIPRFPVSGHDLAAAGIPRGPAMGAAMRTLADAWVASGYALGRDGLVGLLPTGEADPAHAPSAGP